MTRSSIVTRPTRSLLAVAFLLTCCISTQAEDWPAFRGSASGVSTAKLPTQWSASANIAWKTEMPGPGASSPIIIGDKAFLTCYSGYGLDKDNPGEIENLYRHLVCVDMKAGSLVWQKDVKAVLPEDPYTGIGVTAHGYASHTPVSDGKNVYAFFGKSGVHAFDMDGNKLWEAKVGMESDPTKWGSSSSPIVYKNVVIVTASAESQSVIGFDRDSGKELWRQEAKMLDGMWGTPTIVKVDDTRSDLVMMVAKEMWGMDPMTGEMLWRANGTGSQHAYSSLVQDGSRVFAFNGRGGGSIAVDVGGKGDVSETHTVWKGRDTASFASPVGHNSKLYVVSRGIMTVVDAKTGEQVERLRLKGVKQTGGRFGSLDYASPLVAGDHLYYLNGSGQMFVMALGEETKQVSVNQVTNEKETFWGTPAVSNNQMVIRSSKALYCVTDKGETVSPEDMKMAKADEPDAAPGGPGRGGAGGGRGGRGGPGGGGRMDPMTMFNGMDKDKDGSVTMAELEGNPMGERLKALDKDGDNAISKDEFSTGIRALFSRGGSRGGGGGGRSYGQRKDTRPDRPDRPAMKDK